MTDMTIDKVVGAEQMTHEITELYVKAHVKPMIESRAESMRDQFNNLIQPLLSLPKPSKIGCMSIQGAPVQSSEDRTLGHALWKLRWDEEVLGVFKAALELRSSLDCSGGKYSFMLPSLGTEESTAAGIRVVKLPLFPSLSGRHQNKFGGEWTEPAEVSQAQVLFRG
jgi:hypothetical protein